MTNIVKTTTLVAAFFAVSATFVTATNFVQLGIGVLLYPLIAYVAYGLLLNNKHAEFNNNIKVVEQPKIEKPKEEKSKKDDIVVVSSSSISDINKRTFLKIVGATGLSFLVMSVFGRRIESAIFDNQNLKTPFNQPTSVSAKSPYSSPTDGYNISEVDEGAVSFYGFINRDGGWFIMKGDTTSGSFRYVKGESDFLKNWKNRERLEYKYFHEVFI